MKQLINLVLALFTALMLTACGGNPSSTAIDYTKAIAAGNFDAALGMLDPAIKTVGDDKLKTAYSMQKMAIDSRGGISSISVDNEKTEGDINHTALKVQFGNGTSDMMNVTLKKIDGKWKISSN